MRSRFQQGLDELKEKLLRMGGLAEQAIDRATEAYRTRDSKFCQMVLSGEGAINDVRWNSPGDKASLAPGEKIIAVNGQVFSGDRLRAAIRDAKGKPDPIRLIVQSDTYVSNAEIDYHDGERYPALERVEGTPDYLNDITKPLVSSPPAQPAPGKK